MGDRANFGFTQPNGHTIVLYGHWAGGAMLQQLARAVQQAEPRWEDPAYATRIVISQLINTDWNQELSWGLHVNEIGDNEHKIPVINWKKKTFSLHTEAPFQDDNKVKGMTEEPIFTMSLDAFCKKYADDLVSV